MHRRPPGGALRASRGRLRITNPITGNNTLSVGRNPARDDGHTGGFEEENRHADAWIKQTAALLGFDVTIYAAGW